MAYPQAQSPSTPSADPAPSATWSLPPEPHPPGRRTGHGSSSALEHLQQDIRGKSNSALERQDV